jgi:pectate lyase
MRYISWFRLSQPNDERTEQLLKWDKMEGFKFNPCTWRVGSVGGEGVQATGIQLLDDLLRTNDLQNLAASFRKITNSIKTITAEAEGEEGKQ